MLEFLKDVNATQAAIRAGYSKKTARSQGQRMLTNVDIATEIQRAMDARAKRAEISAQNVLQEIASLAFANMGDYIQIQEDGTFFVDFSNPTREQQAAIQEVTVEEFIVGVGKDARLVRRTKLKLVDKGMNLERLGKHLKLFTERHEHQFRDEFDGRTKQELEYYALHGRWPGNGEVKGRQQVARSEPFPSVLPSRPIPVLTVLNHSQTVEEDDHALGFLVEDGCPPGEDPAHRSRDRISAAPRQQTMKNTLPLAWGQFQDKDLNVVALEDSGHAGADASTTRT